RQERVPGQRRKPCTLRFPRFVVGVEDALEFRRLARLIPAIVASIRSGVDPAIRATIDARIRCIPEALTDLTCGHTEDAEQQEGGADEMRDALHGVSGAEVEDPSLKEIAAPEQARLQAPSAVDGVGGWAFNSARAVLTVPG